MSYGVENLYWQVNNNGQNETATLVPLYPTSTLGTITIPFPTIYGDDIVATASTNSGGLVQVQGNSTFPGIVDIGVTGSSAGDIQLASSPTGGAMVTLRGSASTSDVGTGGSTLILGSAGTGSTGVGSGGTLDVKSNTTTTGVINIGITGTNTGDIRLESNNSNGGSITVYGGTSGLGGIINLEAGTGTLASGGTINIINGSGNDGFATINVGKSGVSAGDVQITSGNISGAGFPQIL